MLVRQRFPNFVEVGGEIPIHEINSLDELHSIDFVTRWMASPDFLRLEYSPNDGDPEFLMAIMKDKYWVIAYGREGSFSRFGLQEWQHPC